MHLLEKEKPKSEGIVSTRYRLVGSVVHLGKGVHSGHYVAYLRGDK